MRIFHLHFEHPLWLAVGILTVAALAILAVNRGARADTAYLDLWERALSETPVLERFLQRMSSLLVLLLSAACLLASMAAAGPSREIPGPRDVLFVLDRSATMDAASGGARRLDEGKAWIARQVETLAHFDRAGLAVAGLDAEVLVPPTLDRAALASGLAGVEIEPAYSDLTAAAALDFGAAKTSSPAAAGGPSIESILVSDGCGGKRPFVKTKVVGHAEPNAGIAEIRVHDPFPESEAELDVKLVASAPSPAKRRLAALREGKEVASVDAELPASGEAAFRLRVPRGPGGPFELRLTPGDAFELDDSAAFLLARPSSASIVLVKTAQGPSHAFEAAAHALAHEFDVHLGEMSNPGALPAGAVLFQEGGALAASPDRALLLGVDAPGLAAPAASADAARAVLTYRGDHPLLRGLRFERLLTRRQVKLDGALEPLARAEDGPVVGAAVEPESGGPGRRLIATSFTLDNSNFVTLEGGFPVFLRRAYLWLSGGGAPILGATRAGDDRDGALVGRPIRGPRRLGPWTLPSGVESTASLLDGRCANLDPIDRPEPTLARGAPSAETLGEEFAWSAAAFFALALALEVLTGLREFGAALPRRARAV